jgi:hypothetical protein
MPSTPEDTWEDTGSWNQDLPFDDNFSDANCVVSANESVHSANVLGAPFQYDQGRGQQQSLVESNLHPSLRSTIVYSSAERSDNGLPTPTPANPFGCVPTITASSQGSFVDVASYSHFPSQQIPQDVIPAHYHQQQQYVDPWHNPYTYATANNGEVYHASPAVSFDDTSFTYLGHDSPEPVESNQVCKVEPATPQTSPARSSLRSTKHSSSKRRSAKAKHDASPRSHTFVNPQEWVNPQGQSFQAHVLEHSGGQQTSPSNREHVCGFIQPDNTRCVRGFSRLEHLNRHREMHVPYSKRKFFCVVEDCTIRHKRIGRSDNACQHFRTHLRGDAKGTRNHYKTWPELKQGIVDQYEPKMARRLIKTMEKNPELEFLGSAINCPPA